MWTFSEIITSAVMCAALILPALHANAHHNESHGKFVIGELGYSVSPMCDMQDPMEHIVEAGQESFRQAVSIFQVYASIPTAVGLPICAVPAMYGYDGWKFTPLEEVSRFENVDLGKKAKETVYILKVNSGNGDEERISYVLSTWPLQSQRDWEKQKTEEESGDI